MNITIFGKGNMGSAIGKNLESSENRVTYITSQDQATNLGELVILAVPYPALDVIAQQYQDQLTGKVIVDITNPLNFDTWDELVVPDNSSSAELLQTKLPKSKIIKAFNTNFADTLQTGMVGSTATTVLVAGDNEGKQLLKKALQDSSLVVMDAGKLKRARELEATGFLQMTLAANKQITWTGGFGIVND